MDEKIRVENGSVQMKLGNKTENFDLDLRDEKPGSPAAVKYFVNVLASMIPNIFTYRIANFVGISDVDVKYASKLLSIKAY